MRSWRCDKDQRMRCEVLPDAMCRPSAMSDGKKAGDDDERGVRTLRRRG